MFIRLLTLGYPKVPDAKVHKAVSKVRAARGIFTPVGYLSAFFLAVLVPSRKNTDTERCGVFFSLVRVNFI